jgi:hypothetical protein
MDLQRGGTVKKSWHICSGQLNLQTRYLVGTSLASIPSQASSVYASSARDLVPASFPEILRRLLLGPLTANYAQINLIALGPPRAARPWQLSTP